MKEKTLAFNLNIVLAVLLVVSVAVSAYLCLHVQGVYSILREYNARSALVKSDISDMSAYVQEWRTAISYEETFLNQPYLTSIMDNYNSHLPGVKQNLNEYRSFLEANRDLLVSVSINAPLEIKNVDALLETYVKKVDDFSEYLKNVEGIQANASASLGG